MTSRDFVWRLITGKPKHPPIKNLRQSRDDSLYFDSLTRGTLVTGNPGTGKTRWTAGIILDYALKFSDRPIIVFDVSSAVTNDFIGLYHNLEPDKKEEIDRRLILDMPGHPDWVVPKPMFHQSYGLSEEELVQRAVNIGKQLNPAKRAETPMMASSLEDTAAMAYRLVQAKKDQYGESWQITEVKRLLIDRYEKGELATLVDQLARFDLAPEARWWFKNTLLRNDISRQDVAAMTRALLSVLAIIEPRPLRARYGFSRPTITMREITDKGYIYIVDGEHLANQEDAQAFVFWDEFLQLRTLINKRVPHDPKEKPVLLVIDEVYRLFEIPGMAKALGEISTYFRSRKLMPVIVIQSYWQLDELLKEQIWNLGNIVSFEMDNINDAYKMAQQLFEYDSTHTKFDAPNDRSNPTAEPDRGQYLTEANWIQRLGERKVIMRRYINERTKESNINFVAQTKERPTKDLPIEDVKTQIFKRRAVQVREALKEINNRSLTTKPQDRTTL